mmetsp:Transcript_31470/g.53134  ORF Transcript_31470/g.53134 Transcript_31470/m.53134 type:complete len:257 (+) Transcript_31470:1232-2002(+)
MSEKSITTNMAELTKLVKVTGVATSTNASTNASSSASPPRFATLPRAARARMNMSSTPIPTMRKGSVHVCTTLRAMPRSTVQPMAPKKASMTMAAPKNPRLACDCTGRFREPKKIALSKSKVKYEYSESGPDSVVNSVSVRPKLPITPTSSLNAANCTSPSSLSSQPFVNASSNFSFILYMTSAASSSLRVSAPPGLLVSATLAAISCGPMNGNTVCIAFTVRRGLLADTFTDPGLEPPSVTNLLTAGSPTPPSHW